MQTGPLVSVVTPFYNTAPYLAASIESVLGQTYRDFELVLVNNQSTDGSREIAARFAANDARIRLIDNPEFVDQVTNYNGALTKIAPESKYVKIVQADDLIFPTCLAMMVELAERHPAIGIVSSYHLEGETVSGDGLPHDVQHLSGREACRRMLLTGHFFLGSPTAVMYRADLVRARRPFYPTGRFHEDTEAAYEILLEYDFGFVPQVLSFLRTDNASIMARARRHNGEFLDYFIILERYGPRFLSPAEYARRHAEISQFFYAHLGRAYLRRMDDDFWVYHREGLATLGRQLTFKELAPHVAKELLRMALNPQTTLSGLASSLQQRFRRDQRSG